MTDENTLPDILQGVSAALKQLISQVPGLDVVIAGWDAYNRSRFERNVKKVLTYLTDKADNPEKLFSHEWLKTEEGQQFSRKIFDCAFDAQMEDKQELFVNALINGIEDNETTDLEKLKFVDILRALSRASLMVLADMHQMFKDQVRGPGRHVDPITAFPLVDPTRIAEKLSSKYHPYLVTSSIYEMQSQGLFHNIGEWHQSTGDSYISGGGFQDALCYTDFTYRFVESITRRQQKKLEES